MAMAIRSPLSVQARLRATARPTQPVRRRSNRPQQRLCEKAWPQEPWPQEPARHGFIWVWTWVPRGLRAVRNCPRPFGQHLNGLLLFLQRSVWGCLIRLTRLISPRLGKAGSYMFRTRSAFVLIMNCGRSVLSLVIDGTYYGLPTVTGTNSAFCIQPRRRSE